MKYWVLIILINIQVSGSAQAVSENNDTESLMEELEVYVNGEFVPWAEASRSSGTFHLFKKLEDDQRVVISSEESFVIFINNSLGGNFKRFELSGDSIKTPFAISPVHIGIYTKKPQELSVELITPNGLKENMVLPRSSSSSQAAVIIFIVILVLIATARVIFSGMKGNYYALGRIFSLRDKEEVVLWSKQFSGPNMLYSFIVSGIVSFILIALFAGFKQVGTDMYRWISIAILIFIVLNIRGLVIRFFGRIFQLGAEAQFHSVNLIRITLIMGIVFSSVLLIIILKGIPIPEILYKLGLAMLLIRFLILSLKLINGSNSQIIIKISYICGTELIPLIVIIHVANRFS